MAERYEWGKCLLEAEWARYSAAHQPFGTIACTTHGALAGLLKGRPEPSTWAMMLLGFMGLGYVGYRRARAGHATLAAQTSLLTGLSMFRWRGNASSPTSGPSA
jgi:hypothetical protein